MKGKISKTLHPLSCLWKIGKVTINSRFLITSLTLLPVKLGVNSEVVHFKRARLKNKIGKSWEIARV
jgi:hypothetical protein